MKKVNVIFNDKSLVAILGTLLLIIIGLGIGIYFTQGSPEYSSKLMPNGEMISVAASDLYYEMIEKFENEEDFDSSKAIAEFEEEIEATNNRYYRAMLSFWCAKYIDEYGDGPQEALNYIEKNISKIGLENLDKSLTSDYYSLAESFAKRMSDVDKEEYYHEKLDEILSKDEDKQQ